MSNSAEHYDYYITDSAIREEMVQLYKEEIGNKRNDTLKKLLADTGAIAYTETNSWGKTSVMVRDLAFDVEHEFVGASHMTKPRYDYFEGKRIALTRGKRNDKKGREFNKFVSDANKVLSEAPTYRDWLVDHFNIMRTGFGESTGRGVAMLSTYGGNLGDGLGFAIPNTKEEKHKDVVIPECFTKITYGQ